MLNAISHSTFRIQHSSFSLQRPWPVVCYPAGPPPGGEWGLVASAVFKTVVSARKRRKVGSIPTRLRHVGEAVRYEWSAPVAPLGCLVLRHAVVMLGVLRGRFFFLLLLRLCLVFLFLF